MADPAESLGDETRRLLREQEAEHDDTEPSDAVDEPEGGLFGNWEILNVADGSALSGEAVALQHFFDDDAADSGFGKGADTPEPNVDDPNTEDVESSFEPSDASGYPGFGSANPSPSDALDASDLPDLAADPSSSDPSGFVPEVNNVEDNSIVPDEPDDIAPIAVSDSSDPGTDVADTGDPDPLAGMDV